jgi:hypothetical protein
MVRSIEHINVNVQTVNTDEHILQQLNHRLDNSKHRTISRLGVSTHASKGNEYLSKIRCRNISIEYKHIGHYFNAFDSNSEYC